MADYRGANIVQLNKLKQGILAQVETLSNDTAGNEDTPGIIDLLMSEIHRLEAEIALREKLAKAV